ncbi:MAG: dipeptidase PepE [Thermoplasmatota archaeon]
MKRLLLISNSTSHGSGYLDHCEKQIRHFLGEDTNQVLFVPYAQADMDIYAEKARLRFEMMDIPLVSIHALDEPAKKVREASAIFIGGGNTFLLLKRLYDNGLMDPIREAVKRGARYMGTSAGSNVACPTIQTTNDMPIVHPPSLYALNLVPFDLNPHYVDPDPDSIHMGETRIERIKQFHELNDIPVVGLREGSSLLIEDRSIFLRGPTGAKIFIKDQEPKDFAPQSNLSFLMNGSRKDL